MTGRSAPRMRTLTELLQWRASERAGDTAFTFLVDGEDVEERVSYGVLDGRARALGRFLERRSASADRAVLLLSPSIEYVVALFGCIYSGIVAVPAYPPDPERLQRTLPRLRAIIAEASVEHVLTTRRIVEMRETIVALAPELGAKNWIAVDDIGTADGAGWRPVETTESTTAYLQYTSGSTGTPKGVDISHDNLIQNLRMFYEAARFDAPGTVKICWLPPFHDAGLVDGILQPIFAGCHGVLMPPTAFMQKPIRWLKAISKYRGTHSGAPNFAFDLCQRKIAGADKESLDLSCVEVMYNAAEPVRADTMDRFVEGFARCGFRREAFMPCYGLAETTLIVSGTRASATPRVLAVDEEELRRGRAVPASATAKSRNLVSCGLVAGPQEVAIVDPTTSTRCGPLEVGEIWVRGPNVARGYWRRPEDTEATFRNAIAGGEARDYLRTGDLGVVSPEGELFVTGRSKDVIIVRGSKYYPHDIEKAAEESHPAIRAGCTVAFSIDVEGTERLVVVCEFERRHRPDRRTGAPPPEFADRRSARDRRNEDPEVQAFSNVVAPPASGPPPLDPEDVIAAVRMAVAEDCGLPPHEVVLIKAGTVYKTSSGKLMRSACRAAFLANELEVVQSWTRPEIPLIAPARPTTLPPPRLVTLGEIRQWLVDWCGRRMGFAAAHVSVHKNFVSYGVDSAGAAALAAELERWLGKKVPPSCVYDFPTIERLARGLVESTESANGTAARRLARVGRRLDDLLALVETSSEDEVSAALAALKGTGQ